MELPKNGATPRAGQLGRWGPAIRVLVLTGIANTEAGVLVPNDPRSHRIKQQTQEPSESPRPGIELGTGGNRCFPTKGWCSISSEISLLSPVAVGRGRGERNEPRSSSESRGGDKPAGARHHALCQPRAETCRRERLGGAARRQNGSGIPLESFVAPGAAGRDPSRLSRFPNASRR